MSRRPPLGPTLIFATALIAIAAWAMPGPRVATPPETDTAPRPAPAAIPPSTREPSGADPGAVHGRLAPPIIGGRATWYAADGMIAAAGPGLRHYLGPHWRGTLASVCSSGRCVVVRVSDWCLCRHDRRLVDLSDDAFAQLAPLPVGVIEVEITRAVRVPQPPATDTE